jgi:hypothetical protein
MEIISKNMKFLIGKVKRIDNLFRALRNYLKSVPSLRKIKKFSELRLLFSPWYHDFESLGIKTPFPADKTYAEYQELKGIICNKYILKAMSEIRIMDQQKNVQILEYFAADCYYGIQALVFDKNSKLTAIDKLDESGEGKKRVNNFEKAKLIARVLKLQDRIRFITGDVFDYFEKCDLLLNIGGLYHLENPDDLLLQMRKISPEYAVIQSVVHEDINHADFFVTPAPQWTWGSRFTYGYLRKLIIDSGYAVLEEDFNLLYLNDRPEDRGSAYFLVKRDN